MANSIRKQKAIKKILENNGRSVSKAMREAGYSKSYSKNPQLFLATKTLKEILSDEINNKSISDTLSKLSTKKRVSIISFPAKTDERIINKLMGLMQLKPKDYVISDGFKAKQVFYLDVDPLIALRAIDLIANIRGDKAPIEVDLNGKKKLQSLTDDELAALALQLANNIMPKTKNGSRSK